MFTTCASMAGVVLAVLLSCFATQGQAAPLNRASRAVAGWPAESSQGYCTPWGSNGGDLCREGTNARTESCSNVDALFYLPGTCLEECAAALCAADSSCVGYTKRLSDGHIKLKSQATGVQRSAKHSCHLKPAPAPEHYLSCGKKSHSKCQPERLAANTETHEVRCCADSKRADFKSGWRQATVNGRTVWGESDHFTTSTTGCQHAMKYEEAKSFCEGFGGRLCSRAELSLATQGTGCGHDADMIWTSDPSSDISSSCGSENTELLLAKLGPAAEEFQGCHDSIDEIAGQLGSLQEAVSDVDSTAKDLHEAVELIEEVSNQITMKRGALAGKSVADLAGKIPGYGIFIKTGFKTLDQVVLPRVVTMAELFSNSTEKINNATIYTEKLFKKASAVTGPVASLLTNGHAALEAAHHCAEREEETSYACGTDGARLEAANEVAYPDAEGALDTIGTAGAGCQDALDPIGAAMKAIARAAQALSALFDPIQDIITQIKTIIETLKEKLQGFLEVFEVGDEVAECFMEVFVEPVTDTIDFLSCPITDAAGYVMHHAVDALMQELAKVINEVTGDVISNGVDAVVPDDLEITIPDFKESLPSGVWLATCASVSAAFPDHAHVIEQLNAESFPVTITGATIEQQLVAELTERTHIPVLPEEDYESTCVEAFNELGSEYEACNSLLQGLCDGAKEAYAANLAEVGDAVADLQESQRALDDKTRELEDISCHIESCSCRVCNCFTDLSCCLESSWCCPLKAAEETCKVSMDIAIGAVNAAQVVLQGAQLTLGGYEEASSALLNGIANSCSGECREAAATGAQSIDQLFKELALSTLPAAALFQDMGLVNSACIA